MAAVSSSLESLTQVSRLAWDIYHHWYFAVQDSVQKTDSLLDELGAVQRVLRTVRDDIHEDPATTRSLDKTKKNALECSISGCYHVLLELETLMLSGRVDGTAEDVPENKGKDLWRTALADLQTKLEIHRCIISLCMSSLASSVVARIEAGFQSALDHRSTSDDTNLAIADITNAFAKLNKLPSVETSLDVLFEPQFMQRSMTGSTLAENPHLARLLSSDTRASIGEGEALQLWDSSASTLHSSRGFESWDSRPTRSTSTGTEESEAALSTSSVSRNHMEHFRDVRWNSITSDGPDSVSASPSILVQRALELLARVRHQELSSRTFDAPSLGLNTVSQTKIEQRFQQSIDNGIWVRGMNARDWLRVATWWFLKAETSYLGVGLLHGSDENEDDGLTRHAHELAQSYVNLLKSNWILHKKIPQDEKLSVLLTPSNQKCFSALSNAIDGLLDGFRPMHFPEPIILSQRLNILEDLQPEEESLEEVTLLDGRFITIDQHLQGTNLEKIHYRGFVDAEISSKSTRMRAIGETFMLVVFTTEGESEPQVNICNQRCNLSLQKILTLRDIVPHLPSLESDHGDLQPSPVSLKFGRLKSSLFFKSVDDLANFLDFPKSFFASVHEREPQSLMDCHEIMIFRSTVRRYENLIAPDAQSYFPEQSFKSCEARILETSCDQGWRIVRRLVISSSAGDDKPWCRSLFLPLSHIQLNRKGGSRKIIVRWSDCTHEKYQRDGQGDDHYSYIYDHHNPNIAICLEFGTSSDASEFEKAILHLSYPPIYSCSHGQQERCVYDVSDISPSRQDYKAILLSCRRSEWQYSELFYLFRDIDFQYDPVECRITLSQINQVDYVSTHLEKLFRPSQGPGPAFSHAEKRVAQTTVDFSDSSSCEAFINNLTNGFRLIFFGKAQSISCKPPSRFGSIKSSKGSADIYLWLRGPELRLAFRWDSKVDDRWVTTSLVEIPCTIHAKDSNRVNFEQVDIQRGRFIDLMSLTAGSPKVKGDMSRTCPLIIHFETTNDRNRFLSELKGLSAGVD